MKTSCLPCLLAAALVGGASCSPAPAANVATPTMTTEPVPAPPDSLARVHASPPLTPKPSLEVAKPEGSAGWKEYRDPRPQVLPVDSVETSSTYPNWPASALIDDNASTTWFSAQNDSAARGKHPYILLRLAAPMTVRKVVVIGNRDLTWTKGFSVLRGAVSFLDENKGLHQRIEQPARGEQHDFVFEIAPLPNISYVRFDSLADEGLQTNYGDIGISEIWVE